MPIIAGPVRRRACAILGALLAAGCGSGAHHTSSTTVGASALTRPQVIAAIDATRAVPTAREKLTLALAGPSGSLHFTVDGLADFRATTGQTTVTSSRGQRERAVFENGTVWLTDNAPAFTRELPAGRHWVRASATELEAIGAFAPLRNSMAILDVLRGITSLRPTGPSSADFTFSLPQALARTPADRRAALHNAIHTNGSLTVREFGSVILGPDRRVRSLSVVISGVGGSAGVFLGYTFSITGIGAPVSVTPPATSVPLSSVPRLTTLLRGSATST